VSPYFYLIIAIPCALLLVGFLILQWIHASKRDNDLFGPRR